MRNIAPFNLVFSMELSNADPASTWMGERLPQPVTVDYSGIFVFFSIPAVFFFFFFFFFFSYSYGKK